MTPGLRAYVCLVAGAILTISSLPATAEMSPEDIAGLLARVSAGRPSGALQADYVESRKLALLKNPVTESGTLSYEPPDNFRKEARSPKRIWNISDGRTLWVVFPDENTAEKYPLRSNRALRDSFAVLGLVFHLSSESLSKHFEVTGQKTSSGHVLVLQPRQRSIRESMESLRVVINASDRIEEIQILGKDGNSTRVSLSNERSFQPEPGFFEFRPPENMQVSSPLGE